ncbi:MAG: hypothetical protein R3F40_04835 [Candidatus Competibacteraceae bacterium]
MPPGVIVRHGSRRPLCRPFPARPYPVELLELWRECQPDPQSTAVLEAYLDRHVDAGWREQADTGWKDRTPAAANDHMDRAEAYRVLGLQFGARPR